MQIKIPKAMVDLPETEREDILRVVRQALDLPEVLPIRPATGDEHNMWSQNGESLLAEAEDDLYHELLEPWKEALADVFVALDLPTAHINIEKAYTDEYIAFRMDLIKSKNEGKKDILDIIKQKKEQRDAFLEKVKLNSEKWTKTQMKKLDQILRRNLPDFAKIAEKYAVRAGFLAKIRNKADKEAIDTLGALVDRFPSTISTSEKQGVVLTLREKEKAKAEGRRVKVLPLTKQEAKSVEHAELSCGDKITEIADKHRAGVRQLVIRAQKERWNAQKLAQELFDAYGDQNRDWRRVAITELSMASNDAYLSGCEEGDTVIVIGADNACKHCKSLVIGKSFTVQAGPPEKETYKTDMTMVWAGKSNFGRRVAEYVACLPVHPHCRCRYHKISKFYKVVNGEVVRKTTAEMIQEERARRGLPPDPNLKA